MISNEIYKRIKQETKKSLEKTEEISNKTLFYEYFQDENTYNGYEFYLNLDLSDFAVAYICSKNDDLDFDQTFKKLKEGHFIFDELSEISLKTLIGIFEVIIANGDKDNFVDILQSDNKIKSRFNIKKLLKRDERAYELLVDLLDEMDIDEKSVIGILDIIEENNSEFHELIGIIGGIKAIKESYQEYEESLEMYKEEVGLIRVRDKDKKLLFNKFFKNDFKMDEMSKKINEVKSYGYELIKKDKKNKKRAAQSIKIYMSLEEILNKYSDENKMIPINETIKKIDDEELKKEVLKEIYKHNLEILKKVEIDYEKEAKNTQVSFKKLFSKYNINLDEYNFLIEKSYDETKNILELLKELEIFDTKDVLFIINKTSSDLLKNIYELKQKGYINKDFYKENLNVLKEDTNENKNLFKNIAIIKKNKISPKVVLKDNKVLTFDPKVIEQNIKLLKEYELSSCLRKSEDLDFLQSTELNNKIDLMLELGYEDLLKEDLSILKYNESLSKLIVLKRLGIKATTASELKEMIETDNYISKDNLEDYIFNIIDYQNCLENDTTEISKNDFINELEEFTKTPNTYDINGVIISKRKVLRNLSETVQTINDCMNVLMNNSILTEDEYKTLKSTVKNKQKTK